MAIIADILSVFYGLDFLNHTRHEIRMSPPKGLIPLEK
jgi:hypothetical protein